MVRQFVYFLKMILFTSFPFSILQVSERTEAFLLLQFNNSTYYSTWNLNQENTLKPKLVVHCCNTCWFQSKRCSKWPPFTAKQCISLPLELFNVSSKTVRLISFIFAQFFALTLQGLLVGPCIASTSNIPIIKSNWGHFEHLLGWSQHILQHGTTNFGNVMFLWP